MATDLCDTTGADGWGSVFTTKKKLLGLNLPVNRAKSVQRVMILGLSGPSVRPFVFNMVLCPCSFQKRKRSLRLQ